jgi:large subunit ribosomal protein L19
LHSPFIQKVEIERAGNVRRAKLYYLRKRIGKTATKVADA